MPNRLAIETSPYLLQHKDNPVDWYTWGPEALDLARAEQRPILLSIGYSSCHWCHVMAHESFEDPATADVMNQRFVNIKIDREERPDLDKIYQLAHHVLTQSQGGWPLTMFLDPDSLTPFFGGTYFPKTPRYQLPGFVDLLMRVSDVFAEKREELTEQGAKVIDALSTLNDQGAGEAVLTDQALLDAARDQLVNQYDHAEGGFGRAPKFPMPQTLERLLRHWAYQNRQVSRGAAPADDKNRGLLDMVMTSLTRMARGGIYDHLGGGFCRYSVDQKWVIPHFEKMLYDNAQLIGLYADALTLGPDLLFENAVRDTVAWLTREMRDPGGGFYAALDADSEGEEGKFYVWRRDQVKRLLDDGEYLLVETLYGLDKPANFESKWNLHRTDSWRSVCERLSLEQGDADRVLTSARTKLMAERDTRERPGLDDKVLTSWNGLALKGLAKAAIILREPAWVTLAQQAADFLRTDAWRDGVLHATWKAGHARHTGYLDDYANVLEGLLWLLQAEWRETDAAFARTLADAAVDRFLDTEHGGFFFTAHDHESLIYRPKPSTDDAQPPGNATLAAALHELGHLLGETRYLDVAGNVLNWARAAMERYPAGHCSLLGVLEEQTYPPEHVIIRGPVTEAGEWADKVRSGYQPWRRVYVIGYESMRTLPAYLPKMVSADRQNMATAYVCSNLTCSLPIESLDELVAALG